MVKREEKEDYAVEQLPAINRFVRGTFTNLKGELGRVGPH